MTQALLSTVKSSFIVCVASIVSAVRTLDNHWIGDLIGALSIFVMMWCALVFGYAIAP